MIFIVKLNDSINGLSSYNFKHQKKAIYIHNLAQKNNIYITDFDYIPDFGFLKSDWVDNLHWTFDFHYKWSSWIIYKIKKLIEINNINNSKKEKILIVSDSSLDYYEDDKKINRKHIFKNILNENKIYHKIIAKAGGSFSSKYKSNNFSSMINKKYLKKNNYSSIIILGGINDCFCSNKNKITYGLNKFINISKKILKY